MLLYHIFQRTDHSTISSRQSSFPDNFGLWISAPSLFFALFIENVIQMIVKLMYGKKKFQLFLSSFVHSIGDFGYDYSTVFCVFRIFPNYYILYYLRCVFGNVTLVIMTEPSHIREHTLPIF